MKVRDVMTRSPAMCLPDTPLRQVGQMMVECDCGAIPVVADPRTRRPIGIITDRDIVVRTIAPARNPSELWARDAMTSPVVAVHEHLDVDECLRLLEQRQIRRLIVIDDVGAICGIVSQADIASALPRETAELVQKISRRPGSRRPITLLALLAPWCASPRS